MAGGNHTTWCLVVPVLSFLLFFGPASNTLHNDPYSPREITCQSTLIHLEARLHRASPTAAAQLLGSIPFYHRASEGNVARINSSLTKVINLVDSWLIAEVSIGTPGVFEPSIFV